MALRFEKIKRKPTVTVTDYKRNGQGTTYDRCTSNDKSQKLTFIYESEINTGQCKTSSISLI